MFNKGILSWSLMPSGYAMCAFYEGGVCSEEKF